ncbi:MAG: hypothetical protein K2H20_04660, partial [Bacilli bacterium]|nr:hypothetical protein [Bacilli bacterium]
MKENNKYIIFGSIIGDVIGSPYEFRPIKTKMFKMFNPFCRFTDDTLLTVATMDILNRNFEGKLELNENNIIKIYKEYANEYSLQYNV